MLDPVDDGGTRVRVPGGDQVAHVAVDEYLTRAGAHEGFGHHPAVRASDVEHPGLLRPRQPIEIAGIGTQPSFDPVFVLFENADWIHGYSIDLRPRLPRQYGPVRRFEMNEHATDASRHDAVKIRDTATPDAVRNPMPRKPDDANPPISIGIDVGGTIHGFRRAEGGRTGFRAYPQCTSRRRRPRNFRSAVKLNQVTMFSDAVMKWNRSADRHPSPKSGTFTGLSAPRLRTDVPPIPTRNCSFTAPPSRPTRSWSAKAPGSA